MTQSAAAPAAPHAGFVRALGLFDASCLVVGCIVGVGIFRTASAIASQVTSPSLILALWLCGGLLSLCGALCYAELAAMFPKTGGDYIFLTNTYGRFWGFLFGWTKLFIERTGTIAILGFVFAEYLRRLLQYGEGTTRCIAAAAVAGLTVVNIVGIRWGKYVQNVFTALKITALVSLIAVGLWAWGSGRALALNWHAPALGFPVIQSLGVALVFVLWTYGGWTEAAYVAEEIADPTRNVPRAITQGLMLTMLLYLCVNLSYLLFVPIDRLAHTPLVAAAVMQQALGSAGAIFVTVMIACSAFGALNGYILTGARILFALGQDHALFASVGTLSPRFHTPMLALILNAAIAILLIFTKTFDQIVTYSTVVISVFFTLAVCGVMVLRHTQPTAPRPYRAWGYPVTPVIFILTMLGFILDICQKQPTESMFGFGLLALGLPLYGLSSLLSRRLCPLARS